MLGLEIRDYKYLICFNDDISSFCLKIIVNIRFQRGKMC